MADPERELPKEALTRNLKVSRRRTSKRLRASTKRRPRSTRPATHIYHCRHDRSAGSPDRYPSFSRCRMTFCAASSAVNSAVSMVISASSGAS